MMGGGEGVREEITHTSNGAILQVGKEQEGEGEGKR